MKKKKNKVYFAENVMDTCKDGEEYRKKHSLKMNTEYKRCSMFVRK